MICSLYNKTDIQVSLTANHKEQISRGSRPNKTELGSFKGNALTADRKLFTWSPDCVYMYMLCVRLQKEKRHV